MMDWIDTLWTVAMWVLLGTAASVVAWALFGDWWRGRRAIKRANTPDGERRRCGKCWYDMRGIAGLRCPECGRAAKNERGLQRSRVRWRGVLVGLVVLMPAWVAGKMPEARASGWGRLVPTAVLACWPMDVGAWVDGGPVDWAGKELESRRGREMPGWIGERVLTWRIAEKWRQEKSWDVAILDAKGLGRISMLTHFMRNLRNKSKPTWGAESWPADEFVSVLQNVIAPDGWEHNGGANARATAVGDRLVFACPAEQRAEVEALHAAMVQGAASEQSTRWGGITMVGSRHLGPGWSREQLRDLMTILTECVAIEGWRVNGGDEARMFPLGDRIVIQATESTCNRCIEVLDAVSECSATQRHVQSGDVSVVYVDPRLLVPERSGWGWVTDTGIRNLKDLIQSTVHCDGWEDNGGDEAAIHVFDDRLVIRGPTATRARSIAVLEALVACSEMSRRVETADVTVHCLDRLSGSMKNGEGKWVVKEEESIHLRNLLSNIVDSDAWVENGGDHGLMNTHGPMLVVSGDARMRNRSAVVIEAILSTQHDQVARRCGGSPCTDVNGLAATEHVAVWPLRQMLRAWGALSQREFDAWVAEDPAARDPQRALERLQREGRSGEVRTRGSSEREAGRAILDRLCAGKPETWYENSRLSVFHDVLVLWTLDPGVVEMVEDALPAMKNGPGAIRAD